jgi:hypothetical protein
VARLERDMSRLERELAAGRRKGGPGGLTDVIVPSPEAVQSMLPPDTVLLEYVLGPEGAAIFVIDPGGVRIRRLPARRAEVLAALRGLQFQMNKFGLGRDYVLRHGRTLTAAANRHLRDLGRMLLDPVEAELARSAHVIVAAHDLLHYVPFHALRTARGWLLDRHTVSSVPSASILRLCLTRRTGGRGALVAGVPAAGTPAVGREVDAVAGALPDAHVLFAAEATLAAFRREAPARRFVHLSTHGIFRPDSPMASAVRLWDHWLTFADVASLHLRADLVVLSACHAGLDRIFSGDEQMGLSRAILLAGAAALVTTLWAVDDESMAAWMSDFYHQIARGQGPAVALRTASLLARERDPHPYYWAPCVLIGRPGKPGVQSAEAGRRGGGIAKRVGQV